MRDQTLSETRSGLIPDTKANCQMDRLNSLCIKYQTAAAQQNKKSLAQLGNSPNLPSLGVMTVDHRPHYHKVYSSS